MALFKVLRRFTSNRSILQSKNGNNFRATLLRCSFCSQTSEDKWDRTSLFFDDKVQDLLKKLTRMEVSRVFRKRKDGSKLEPPQYALMTTADLQKAQEKALKRGEKKLQMPPVLAPRKDTEMVLVDDDKLRDYCTSNLVFTDITFGKSDQSRTIVVREPNGKLRHANYEERSRMVEMYFPRPGRKVIPPSMFEPKNLQAVLERGDYEFALDRACIQFEPDDPLFIRVCRETFSKVDSRRDYSALRSTRHYGPMLFHLSLHSSIDNLLVENLQTDRLEDAIWLVSLYHLVNPQAKSKSIASPDQELDFIKAYIDHDSTHKEELELNFKAYKDLVTKSEQRMEQ